MLEDAERNREAWQPWASLRLFDPSGHSGIHVLPSPSLHEESPEQACFLPARLRCLSQRTAAADGREKRKLNLLLHLQCTCFQPKLQINIAMETLYSD